MEVNGSIYVYNFCFLGILVFLFINEFLCVNICVNDRF